jgi:hypothetical protein
MLMTKVQPLKIINRRGPVRKQTGEERREDGAQEDRGYDCRKLAAGEARGRLEIRQSSADDADIDAVQQAAMSGDEEKERAIPRWGCVDHAESYKLSGRGAYCKPGYQRIAFSRKILRKMLSGRASP